MGAPMGLQGRTAQFHTKLALMESGVALITQNVQETIEFQNIQVPTRIHVIVHTLMKFPHTLDMNVSIALQ